ncbi:MAG: outer membrane beta-barrel protein [Thermodesulfobacteriota bacterium]|nr:outer membrane beta-barrel protein [Thermodesulfobacteriota bacterium]
MMKRLVVAFLVSSLALFSSAVSAQESRQGKDNYVGVIAGGVFPGQLDWEERFPDRVPLSDVKLENGLILGVKLGHRPNKLARSSRLDIAVELEAFAISGTDVGSEYYYFHPFGSTVDLRTDISIMTLMLNVLLRDPYGQVHPYGGVGMGWTWFAMEDVKLVMQPGWQWPDMSTNVNRQGDLEDDAFAFQVLLGIGIDLTERLSADLGYRYLRTEPEFEFSKGGVDLDTKMTYKTHMITVGLTYAF